MGDFNAEDGSGNEECVGQFGYGNRNERGEELVNFATAHRLKVMSSFFKKRRNRKWTWRSPNYEALNEIAYILTDQPQIFTNVEVVNRVNVGREC